MAGIASSSSSSEDLTLQDSGEKHTAPSDQSVNSLLQKRRCELMYELKRLQHGERPVTGTESRDKVNHFFDRRLKRLESSTAAGVANVDDVETHRPEQVVIEVEGLMQKRSVSSVLGSEQFRRSLENVVRSHMRPNRQRRRATDIPAPPRGPPPPPSSSQTAAATAAPGDDTDSVVSDRLSISSLLAFRLPTQLSLDNLDEEATEPAEPAELDPEIAPLQNRDPELMMRSLNHEELVMEISELVHQQLVSSTLSGASGFRSRLERLVMRRVNESGTNGQAVQQEILSLPPSNVRRNDFTHLGLQNPDVGLNHLDLDDAVSVISATASATIPYTQSNAAVNREISSMRSQISQLTSLLRQSLDLQVDIQRSIKQEVAAAMNQTASEGSTAAIPRARCQRADDSKCIVCVEGEADSVLYRCGHICMCYSCAVRMKRDNGTCPACRAPITDIVRAYRISHD